MKKQLILGVCFVLVFAFGGCTVKKEKNTVDNNKTYAVSTYIRPEMKNNTEEGEFMASRPSYTTETIKKDATDIAIVRVINKTKSDMAYTLLPATYGDLLVNDVISGDLKRGAVIPYIRNGGVVSVTQYETTDDSEAIAKREYLRKKAGIKIDKDNTYYDMRLENDISIEQGKTYLAYMKYHEDKKYYEIIGYEQGLREVDKKQETKQITLSNTDIAQMRIKNNKTNEFESLQNYIDTFIKKKSYQ